MTLNPKPAPVTLRILSSRAACASWISMRPEKGVRGSLERVLRIPYYGLGSGFRVKGY